MIRMKIDKDVVWELEYNGENIIYPWGIEIGDSYAFFSLEKGVGYRYKEIESDNSFDFGRYKYQKTVEMPDGKWRLEGIDYIENDKIVRKVKAICLEDTMFIDFVMRFRFKKELFNIANISGISIEHHNTNVYYQYPTDKVALYGKYKIHINVLNSNVPNKMIPHMYVRDHEDEWVVHARMIPCECDRKVIKLCNSFCKTKPIPQWMTNLICSNEKLYEYLKYHNERTPYTNRIMRRVSPNAFALVRIGKGEELMWEIETKISSNEKTE